MTDPTQSPATDQLVLITRIFDAPRAEVFAAWTDPARVAAWYGPKRFDTPVESIVIEPRVGGRYELTMVERSTGTEHPVSYEIIEFCEPELLVLRCPPMPEVGLPDGSVTRVELHDHGAKTRMTLTDGPYPGPASGHAEAGWDQALVKLDGLLVSPG